ncbi:MAG: serine/threonine-protein kinase [Verrucomicrobiales bacterium]
MSQSSEGQADDFPTAQGSCRACGARIPSDAPGGICPACMIMRGFNDVGDDLDGDDCEEDDLDADGAPTVVTRPGESHADSVVVGGASVEKTMGRYDLIKPLGEGGMGEVYLAEQTSPVIRKVALKVIKLGMNTREIIERFEAERQALALMDHPGIARVLDAGTTANGRPYFVMELVQGEPVTTFCAERGLGLKERLQLFVDICAAVQHAHQKGIVHRDLKPSNLLASYQDGEAQIKVIDFGIAKAVDPGLSEVSLYMTRGDRLLGTPTYMSPEQAGASGMDVDTRSDIYSLGVVLYELLTGRLPIAEEPETHYEEYLKQVREVEPQKPSTLLRTQAAGHVDWAVPFRERQLRGDLDWIVLKALEKDRERRYPSVSELAQDIVRHLNDEPITAGRPSRWYRARKFIRKHRYGLAAAVVMVVLLVSGIVVSSWQAVRARKAERASEERLAAGEQVIRFMLDDLTRELKALGRLEVLAGTTEEVNRFYDAIPVDVQTSESRKIRADALVSIGRVRSSQGDMAAAESAFYQAQALYQKLAESPKAPVEVFEGLGSALILLGDHLESQGRFEQAEEAAAKALAIYQDLRLRVPGDENITSGEAAAWLGLGTVHYGNGHYDRALKGFRSALEIWQRLAEQAPEDKRMQQKYAQALQAVAMCLRRQDRPAEAKAALTEALESWTQLAASSPGDATILTGQAETLNNAAVLANSQGDLDEAARLTSEAVAIRKQLVARDPSNAGWLHALALVEQNLGEVEYRLKDYHSAAAAFESAFASWERLRSMAAPLLRWRDDFEKGVVTADSVYRKLWSESLNGKGASDRDAAVRFAVKTLSLRLSYWENSPTDRDRRHQVAQMALQVASTHGKLGNPEGGRPFYQLARYLFGRLAADVDATFTDKLRADLRQLEAIGNVLGDAPGNIDAPDERLLAQLPVLPKFLLEEMGF